MVRVARHRRSKTGVLLVGPYHSAGYPVARGWADELDVREGEVAAYVVEGDPYFLGQWAIGSPAEVVAECRRRGRAELAEYVARATMPEATPCALLGHVLGLSAERVAEAARTAGVALTRGPES